MTKLLAVCFLMLYMATATFGLKCYTCNSTESVQECEKLQELKTCTPGWDRCLTFSTIAKMVTTKLKITERAVEEELSATT
ncbi:hypothetical protein OS493_003356 [Desmophyllum pertusum]|uniref:UPAR/Ly6 domain-containing protein n=1 Tax=Desmophyllum pertusum TaxID=174260 RepID=A0A9X0A5Y2_9CNID|nr:hypothetical protein OS493_003356 [Desmophyllum pertusum]